MNPRALREFTEIQLQYRFERIPGVAQLDIFGGLNREIHVNMDRSRMHVFRISPAQVISALHRENLNEPVGQVVEGDFEVLMRTEGEFISLDQIRQTMVARRDGRSMHIDDIAEVQDSYQEVRSLVRVKWPSGTAHGRQKTVGGQYRRGGERGTGGN